MTVSADLFKSIQDSGFSINLPNLYENVKLTPTIVGIKYNWMNKDIIKGHYSTTVYKKSKVKQRSKINAKSFYNQISFIVKIYEDKQVNAKLFANGKLQVTGCRSTQDAVQASMIISEYLNSMCKDTKEVELQFDNNNVLRDYSGVVYSQMTDTLIIGWYDFDSGEYIIDKKRCAFDNELNLFVTKKTFKSRSHFLYDVNGTYVGHASIELLKNKKKLYTKNTNVTVVDNLVYVNDNVIIGKYVVHLSKEPYYPQTDKKEHVGSVELYVSPYINVEGLIFRDKVLLDVTGEDIDVFSIMANYNLGYEINRQKMYQFFQEHGYLVKYNPETYSGLYVMYKCSTLDEKQNGLCSCSNKCTCENVSIIFFQSGNVIFSGAKSITQLNHVFYQFIGWLNNLSHIFQKKGLL
jgi:TATA-box binding protein (TBP) (component of TFIID and TFIIIB)